MENKQSKFPLFRLNPGQKTPAHKGWQGKSTRDPGIIAKWKREGYNLGVDCRTGGLCVIDVDNKAFDGSGALLKLEKKYGPLPATYTVKTPTGGYHYYFKGSTANRVGMRPGIDVRSAKGYVVAEGSEVDAGVYKRRGGTEEVARLPKWLKELIGEVKEREENRDLGLEMDTPDNILAATRYAISAEPAIEGEGGDHRTFSTAAKMADLGVSEATALSILLEHYNPRCQPEWDPDGLAVKVANAYAYKVNADGVLSPELKLKKAQELFKPIVRSRKALTLSSDRIPVRLIPKRDWVIGYELIRRYIAVLVSPGGIGKSTFSFLEALSIASGRSLTGDKVHVTGPVWIHNAEDPLEELEMRLAGAAKFFEIKLSECFPIYLTSGRDISLTVANVQAGVTLVNEKGVDDLIALIQEHRIVYISLDPLIGVHECDENANQSMNVVMRVLNQIADQTGAAVRIVHHTAKGKHASGEQDAGRGATAIMAAARIASTLSTMTEKEAGLCGVSMTDRKNYIRYDNAKQNLAPPASLTRWFKRESVRIENGESVGTLSVIELETVDKETPIGEYLKLIVMTYGEGDHDLREVLKVIAASTDDERPGKTISQWFKRALSKFSDGAIVDKHTVSLAKHGKDVIISIERN